MAKIDGLHFPKLTEILDYAVKEFAGGVSETREMLVMEGFFDRTSSSVTHVNATGWELSRPTHTDSKMSFDDRWSDADERRQRTEPEHPHELDFDR